MDILLLGCYTRFSYFLIKWNSQRAKIMHPICPIPSTHIGWTNWQINPLLHYFTATKVETLLIMEWKWGLSSIVLSLHPWKTSDHKLIIKNWGWKKWLWNHIIRMQWGRVHSDWKKESYKIFKLFVWISIQSW